MNRGRKDGEEEEEELEEEKRNDSGGRKRVFESRKEWKGERERGNR